MNDNNINNIDKEKILKFKKTIYNNNDSENVKVNKIGKNEINNNINIYASKNNNKKTIPSIFNNINTLNFNRDSDINERCNYCLFK